MEKHYPSLLSLKAAIDPEWPNEPLLFRGEARPFPKTTPGSQRMIEDMGLSFAERTFLLDAAGLFIEYIEDEFPHFDPDEVEMFLQHYGLPNDLIDFTSSFEIASFFACKDTPKETGTLAVLLRNQAVRRGLHVYDGRALGMIRPTLQHGWALRCCPGDPSDLKASDPRLDGIIFWFSFDKRPNADVAHLHHILDTTGDPRAEHMRNWLQLCQKRAWQVTEDSPKDRQTVQDRIALILKDLN